MNPDVGTDWAGFAQVAPDLARRARAAAERCGFVLVGTIRRDGTPRISPVEIHFVRHQLMLVMIAGSHKARDLDRDPRLVLQTPVTHPASPEPEAKLRGHVIDVDETQREATAASIEAASGWRPRNTWRFFAVTLNAANYIEWQEDEMTLSHWDNVNGLRPAERRRLDMEASRYVPVIE
ncbi:pyridoxamine 5'-phosphate oxidase family protein [Streptomyces luteolus]|uniref:Pyridoxamine 5'-phosphate oxidase family protein n=1 Tax=Streptomyces luteolus TaxID=3043615 RepID=A0ABT6T7G4_9ACTN|nr:pyridoxamine 5'-phosphate oxidase family protein [Streptomyces sp. B-S-A12]MDI3423842.1 pyridoxamine 5'-phosphate oxidase family protein [Streptomyces sp. B-S-A12]